MCCLCFDQFTMNELRTLPNGKHEDVCKDCAINDLEGRIAQLEECLNKVVTECYYSQFEEVIDRSVIKFASNIFHIALEADVRKDYYAAKTIS